MVPVSVRPAPADLLRCPATHRYYNAHPLRTLAGLYAYCPHCRRSHRYPAVIAPLPWTIPARATPRSPLLMALLWLLGRRGHV